MVLEDDGLRTAMEQGTPLTRIGDPEEIVPLLEKLAKKTSSAGKPSNSAQKSAGTVVGQRVGLEPTYQRAYDPHDHYNTTIQRGDRQGPSLIVIFVIAGLLLLLFQALGWLSGGE